MARLLSVAVTCLVAAGLAATAIAEAGTDGAVVLDPEHEIKPVHYGRDFLATVCASSANGGFGEYCASFASTLRGIFRGLEEIAEPITPEFAVLTQGVAKIADAAGFSTDELKYLLCMLAGYPLGLIFSFLPNATTKKLFSLSVGVFIAMFVFGSMWIHSFITSAVVYLFLAATQGLKALDGSRHFIVFGFMMAYMSFSHIFRCVDDYLGWSLDYTGPQMLLTIKLTAMGFNLHDGTVARESTTKRAKVTMEKSWDAKKQKRVADDVRMCQDRLNRSLERMPSMLEFFSWTFCFQNFLAGPAFELREYLDAINGDAYTTKDKSDKSIPAGRITRGFRQLALALFFIAVMVVGTGKFPVKNLHDPVLVNASAWYQRLPIAWLTLFFTRTKYYFAWFCAEGSAILCGFGYTPKNKNGNTWGGASNMDVITFETAENVSAGSRAWNKFTQVWLERYVYRRTGNSLAATYFVSAFWHGFYPGYYLFFMSVPLLTNTAREMRRRIRPRIMGNSGLKFVYDISGRIATSLSMNYLAAAFQALALDYALFSWKSWAFAGHIAMVGTYILVQFIPSPKPKKD